MLFEKIKAKNVKSSKNSPANVRGKFVSYRNSQFDNSGRELGNWEFGSDGSRERSGSQFEMRDEIKHPLEDAREGRDKEEFFVKVPER